MNGLAAAHENGSNGPQLFELFWHFSIGRFLMLVPNHLINRQLTAWSLLFANVTLLGIHDLRVKRITLYAWCSCWKSNPMRIQAYLFSRWRQYRKRSPSVEVSRARLAEFRMRMCLWAYLFSVGSVQTRQYCTINSVCLSTKSCVYLRKCFF